MHIISYAYPVTISPYPVQLSWSEVVCVCGAALRRHKPEILISAHVTLRLI